MIHIKSPLQMTTRRPKVYCRDYLPLQESAVIMFFAPGGVGKSFAAIREALEFVRETGKKAALWLTEDSEGETRRRYERLVEMIGGEKQFFDERISFIAQEPVRFTKLRDGNAYLTPEYTEVRLALLDYSLVVLDPLLQFNGCDENSNTHAGVLMGALKEWAAEENKVIILLHHATLTQNEQLKARGAGEWVNGTRGVYEITLCADKSQRYNRLFRLTKDNGLSYWFRDQVTGKNERELLVFPQWREEQKHEDEDLVTITVANHNDQGNPKGFEPIQVAFRDLHLIVTAGRCYSPYTFAGGHRLSANNLGGANMLCFDFDDGVSIEQKWPIFKSYESFLVTTRSHRKNGNLDRFRVFLRLSQPLEVPVDDHAEFMRAIFEKIGNVDPATKDPARFFFASPPDAEYRYSNSDRAYDWRPVYDEMRRKKVMEKLVRSQQKEERKPSGKEPNNTLPGDDEFITKDGELVRFSDFRSRLGIGDKAQVQCRHGIDHGGVSPARNVAAFIKKDSNGNVFYSCSGGRCAGEGTLWCAGWK